MAFHSVCVMYVLGVSKIYLNQDAKKHRDGTRKYPFVYFIDDSGRLRRKRIGFFEIPLWKSKVVRLIRVICGGCGLKNQIPKGKSPADFMCRRCNEVLSQ